MKKLEKISGNSFTNFQNNVLTRMNRIKGGDKIRTCDNYCADTAATMDPDTFKLDGVKASTDDCDPLKP